MKIWPRSITWMNFQTKLARTCGIFFKIRHLLPTNVLVSLYNSLFSSFLYYGIIVWGLTYDIHTKPIYLLQKKVVRAIAFQNFTSASSPIFSDLKILKLYDLLDLKLLTFVYESVNRLSPPYFHNFFYNIVRCSSIWYQAGSWGWYLYDTGKYVTMRFKICQVC